MPRLAVFVPGFAVVEVVVSRGVIFVAAEVSPGRGRVPEYAGNIDIINLAAIRLAEARLAHANGR